jgi:tetratricopeptide (TPR) repeat protein
VEQVIQPEQSAPAVVIQQAPAPQTAVIAPAPQPQAAPPVQRSSPVRVNRELSLEEQDRNNSQEAVMLVQSGRINEAYQGLLLFISEHPDAHQSRETLATLLLAQGEMGQARSVVDGGLSLVPNYGPFKKIKARLLMQDGASAQALALLRNVPPAVATDPEYHELLASLYQQNSSHDLAVASYQDLLRFNSQQGRWWTGLAISLEALGKNADALASYQAALQTSNLDAGLRQYIQNRIFNLSKQQ